jgi:hypothetical protein
MVGIGSERSKHAADQDDFYRHTERQFLGGTI